MGITDRDRGSKRLMQELAKTGEITVGIHEAEGAAAKTGEDEGMSLIDVAVVHEFGAEFVGIPRRSFIRDWVDENEQAHADQTRKVAQAVIAGKLDIETAMKRLGVLRQAEVQKRISDGIEPPLSPVTIARKGSSKPLIHTGQMRGAVTHKVKVTR